MLALGQERRRKVDERDWDLVVAVQVAPERSGFE
jgi:hypothetical protein